jgi:hypothetical protein
MDGMRRFFAAFIMFGQLNQTCKLHSSQSLQAHKAKSQKSNSTKQYVRLISIAFFHIENQLY